jgi:hypothetical protein
MVKYSLLLTLLLSLPIMAQVRTGGGTIDADPNMVDTQTDGGSAPSEISKKIREYTGHLKTRESVCRGQGMKYLNIDPDLMQVYMKLSVLKTTFVADNQCADSKAYFQCLSDKEAIKKLKVLLKDKRTLKYMKETYEINEAEAKAILNFFKDLKKGCPGETCKE